MLDVHVLISPNTPKLWRNRALASLRVAVRHSPFPVEIFELPARFDHFGLARKDGYAKGNAPWKTYIDDDDIVLPDAFEVIGRHFPGDFAALLSREYVMQNDCILGRMLRRHHLPIYRADIVADFPFEDWRAMTDLAVLATALGDPRGVKDIDDAIYIHRIYAGSNGRKLRAQYPEERSRIATIMENYGYEPAY